MREVAAVIVYYDTPDALRRCLDGIRSQSAPPAHVIVVDNSACEGYAPAPVAAGTTVLTPDRNLGFGAACNRGAAEARAADLLVLNADVRLASAAIAGLAGVLDREPRVGAVGPRIVDADARIELSARDFPGIRTGLVGRASLLTRLLRRAGRIPDGLAAATGSAGAVDWVSGACTLVRREALDAVAGYDEGFWMYWEDADLCQRLSHAGWTTWYEPAAEVRHWTSSSGRSARTIAAFHASAARYFDKHLARGPWTSRCARAALAARSRVLTWRTARRRT